MGPIGATGRTPSAADVSACVRFDAAMTSSSTSEMTTPSPSSHAGSAAPWPNISSAATRIAALWPAANCSPTRRAVQ